MARIAHDTASPTLEVTDLRVLLGGNVALDGITFALRRGDSVAVVGPNGAGKSTLFRVIAGLIEAQSGRIAVYGSRPDSHTCIAYVPQASIVDWSFPVTVFDVVMMGRTRRIGLFRRPSRADRGHAYQCLEMVNMEDMSLRQIGELSGGQKQRVFIARALAQEAEIVLMDEPLTGLDVKSQNDIFAVLRGLSDRGVTLMVSTHDLDVAAERFARIMLLNRTLVALGTREEVLRPELLLPTFGGHASVQGGARGAHGGVLIYDTCCDGGDTATPEGSAASDVRAAR